MAKSKARKNQQKNSREKYVELLRNQANKSEELDKTKSKLKRLKSMSFFNLLGLIFISSFFFGTTIKNKIAKTSNKITLGFEYDQILILLGLITYGIFGGLTLYKLNKNNTINKDSEKIRKIWRDSLYIYLLGSILVTAGMSLGLDLSSNFFTLQITMIFFLSIAILLKLILIVIFNNPKLLTNKPLIIFSDYLNLLIWTTFFILPFSSPGFQPNSVFIVIYLSILTIIHIILLITNKDKLTLVQRTAIQYINIEKLSFGLTSILDDIDAEKRAIVEIEKRINKGDYAYLTKMNTLLLKKFSPNRNIPYTIIKYLVITLFSFFAFLITSIGEGLIQDLFNEKIKVITCKILGLFC